VRPFIAAFLVLPLAWPASAQQRPTPNLYAPHAVIETRPLPPVIAPAPVAEEEEAEDDRSADLKRQQVVYAGQEVPGTIIIDTSHTYLFLVMEGGQAMRYGIGVGREGFTWNGRERVSRMAEWPDWYPPKEMIERQPYLPRVMAGGTGNPLGARAMYLGSTLYRIHGTNQPNTIGKYVSSGCIRLTNDDIEDLYARVKVGAQVVVLQADGSAPTAQIVSPAKSTAVTGRPSAPALSNHPVEITVQNAIVQPGSPAAALSEIPLPQRKPSALTRAKAAKSDAKGMEVGRNSEAKVVTVAVRAKDSAKTVEGAAAKRGKPAKADTTAAEAGRKAGSERVAKLEIKREKNAAMVEAKAEIKNASKHVPKAPAKPKVEATVEPGDGKAKSSAK
jgi:lipoprotein-anchoring transpeptidase ErfK/SrfK